MNIKSLLLGSAAAAVAFSGAQAADAIVIAEPEPMEYVRICDAYGAGYFYIPGTETCLRISGWVRYQVETADRSARINVSGPDGLEGTVKLNGNLSLSPTYDQFPSIAVPSNDGFDKYTGAQINFDARSETEYGTLRGWVQLETLAAGGTNRSAATDINISINRAVIQLGGLWLGYADSLFASSSNIGGSGLGNYGGYTYADTFNYFYQQRHQIGYQFNGGNGFWAGLSLEHDDVNSAPNSGAGVDYMPDVVGKVAYSQGWGGAWLAVAYDESAEGVGVRGGIEGKFAPLTVRMDAYYQSDAAVVYGRGSRWAVQATGLYQITPTFGVAAGVEYRDRLAGAGMWLPGSSSWAGQLGVNWQPVKGFQIGADVTHQRDRGSATITLPAVNIIDAPAGTYDAAVRQENTRFRLRFQRNF